ncbi:MAG TPA: hypothetical protein VGO61_01555 [Steroidobacteraceae bacterium]|jgi:hypothetical protein|nr:hypothetical protein [Steroidobacteraceae bacterium]
MGILKKRTMALSALVACAPMVASAAEWQLELDVRALSSDGHDSFLQNGQGKLRFDEDHQGIQLGRLRAALNQSLGEVFSAHIEASRWDADDKNPIDLTEAYVEYRPYPHAGLRTRLRLGAFYPPMSLESRALGWQTPYTITPSAISSWIGEEIRTVGLEGQVDWLGTRSGHRFDLQLTAAVFGWNDPAGTMLGAHGFAFSDRQTTLFGRVGAPQTHPEFAKKELFHEIDGRPGYYLGAQARYLDRAVLNVLHYDNRADPSAQDLAIRDFAWLTKFDAAALRLETGSGWTAILQALDGTTTIAPGGFWLNWKFDSQSALLAKRTGAHMLAVRYDEFDVEFLGSSVEPGSEEGHAWTLAYSYDRGDHWHFALEWLRVESEVPARVTLLGEPPLAVESKLELSARYALNGTF